MASFKIIFALVALAAIQCQGHSVAVKQPKAVDPGLVIEHVIKIIENIIKSVDQGIETSQPSIDIIVAQLQEDVGKYVKELLDKLLADVKNVEASIGEMIKFVSDLLEKLKAIDDCTKPIAEDSDVIINNLELAILKVIQAEDEKLPVINDIVVGIKNIFAKFKDLFNKDSQIVADCLTPGYPTAADCLNTFYDGLGNELMLEIGAPALLLLNEIETDLPTWALDIFNASAPLVEKARADGQDLLNQCSQCIAKLPPPS